MSTQIKFKLLHPDAQLPTRAHATDACFDVVATTCKIKDGYIEYGLGFATEMPEWWAGYFYPRSSISKTGLMLCNSTGIIDSGYRGEWLARFRYLPPFEDGLVTDFYGPMEREETKFYGDRLSSSRLETHLYKAGDRIGQIRFAPLPIYDLVLAHELSDTERGASGFGSTGK
jgi:dUTP pyrophosphatase